jgi:hypothetical protein
MIKRLLPARQCRWCRNDLRAGEIFCKACRGNRLVPAQWWPAAVASVALLACASLAMNALFVAIYVTESAPAPNAPATATPVQTRATDQTALPSPPLPAQSFSVLDPPTTTPASSRAATLAPTNTPTPAPTNTPTPAPTNTPTPAPTDPPTLTPTITPTPAPTSTPTPVPTPPPTPTAVPVPDPRFRADQTTVGAGGCTALRWDVDGVQGVFLDGQGRPGHSTEVVCPELSHTYTLKVVMPDGREASHSLHVQVIGYRPLKLSVLVTYRGCDTTENYRAEISMWAEGGDKQYTYYLGDLDHYIGGPTDKGMVYRISWQSCGGIPGYILVRSGDGQEVQEPFWVEPPDCCEE